MGEGTAPGILVYKVFSDDLRLYDGLLDYLDVHLDLTVLLCPNRFVCTMFRDHLRRERSHCRMMTE